MPPPLDRTHTCCSAILFLFFSFDETKLLRLLLNFIYLSATAMVFASQISQQYFF
jgi:hypothetical protein